jgi:hypothetical protein
MAQDLRTVEQLLERIGEAEVEHDRVTLESVMHEVGERSFGPLLLLAGLITAAPVIGDIPGVPTIMGTFVLLTSGQLLFGRRHLWLPEWLLERSVQRGRLCRAMTWMRRPARFFDRLVRPRLAVLVHGAGMRVIALVCVLVALVMPTMEIVPFTANGAGVAIAAFGLALMARDGLIALIAFAATALTLGAVAYGLL